MGVLKMRVNELYRLPVFLGPQTQPPRPQRAPSRWGHFFLGRLPARPCCASMADGHFNAQRKNARRMQAPHRRVCGTAGENFCSRISRSHNCHGQSMDENRRASEASPLTRRGAKEDERLRELAVSSATLSEIAEKLNRTKSATQARAYTLRVGLRRFRTQRRSLSKWG